jgi:Cd2+/Zn2+-exporting ATPase/Cu+-exporting ATPase
MGKTTVIVSRGSEAIGLISLMDESRAGARETVQLLRGRGMKVEMLTGDNENTARAIAEQLGFNGYHANLLPDEKVRVVEGLKVHGPVVMVGDGVNDAPALAQADVGIAMGVAGSDVAIEAAHIALMSDDWRLVPEALRIARRTMRVVKGNIAFTAAYNLVGLSLAAFGILPPALAAAAQSIPDLIILGNSSRLIRQ